MKKTILPISIAIVFVLSACVSTQAVADYNDFIVESTDRMDMQCGEVAEIMGLWFEGQTVDVAALETEQNEFSAASATCLAELQAYSVPNADTCKAMQTVVLDYTNNTIALAKAYDEVVAYIKDHNPATDGDA
ncbi:MAG: hypothetical protein PF961_13315, partial [Planctomycetota bacterium]|nr:hypothetical protein [Planctomycetota bacterium]